MKSRELLFTDLKEIDEICDNFNKTINCGMLSSFLASGLKNYEYHKKKRSIVSIGLVTLDINANDGINSEALNSIGKEITENRELIKKHNIIFNQSIT